MYEFGVLGVGKMGGSILNGIITSSLFKKDEILLCVHNQEHLNSLENEGYNVTLDINKLFTESNVILLAIKPQMFEEVLAPAKALDFSNKCVISIAAGITLNWLKGYFQNAALFRVMPNTPAMINMGVSTICTDGENAYTTLVKKIFTSIGAIGFISENEMDASLPLNGSMPAYLYYFAKLFIDEAVKNNIDYETAVSLTANTIISSANMILKSSDNLDTLIKNVCSKGGTTIAGLNMLDDRFKDSISDCYNACMNRSKELSK